MDCVCPLVWIKPNKRLITMRHCSFIWSFLNEFKFVFQILNEFFPLNYIISIIVFTVIQSVFNSIEFIRVLKVYTTISIVMNYNQEVSSFKAIDTIILSSFSFNKFIIELTKGIIRNNSGNSFYIANNGRICFHIDIDIRIKSFLLFVFISL